MLLCAGEIQGQTDEEITIMEGRRLEQLGRGIFVRMFGQKKQRCFVFVAVTIGFGHVLVFV